MKNSLTEATTNLHGILEPLSPEDRNRVIQAVLMLLGQAPMATDTTSSKEKAGDHPSSDGSGGLPNQAKAWMQRHHLSIDTIEKFIHLDGGKATAIQLPGANTSGRETTRTTYLMAGLASLFSSGDPSFTDEQGRALCIHFGCFDKTNHSTYVKSLGNSVTGSKSAGWKLTAPGLNAIAALISGTPSE